MSQIKYTTEFAATPATIWPYLDDADKIGLWMTGVVENRVTSEGPPGVGATFECDIKEGRKVSTFQGEVLKYEPQKLLGVKMVGGCGKTPMTMFADYELTEVGSGRTRLEYTCRCAMPSGFFWKLMGPLFRLMGKMMVKKFMRNLRGLVENPDPQPAAS